MARSDRLKIDADAEDTNQPASREEGMRVVRALPNPSTQHNGVTFATVKLGERTVHISERITPEQAARFCRVTGYSLFDGDEGEHARTIEDALDAARKVPVDTGGRTPADAGLATQLAEQQRINQRQSEEIAKLRERCEGLVAQNRALTRENQALKESGAKVAG